MTDRNSDMRHILAQVSLLTGGSIMESEDGFSSLDALGEWAETVGVLLDAYDDGDEIYLSDISRAQDAAKGSGATVMQALCTYADCRGKPISLLALFGNEQLVRYYGKFGFVVADHDADDEDADGIPMVRDPR